MRAIALVLAACVLSAEPASRLPRFGCVAEPDGSVRTFTGVEWNTVAAASARGAIAAACGDGVEGGWSAVVSSGDLVLTQGDREYRRATAGAVLGDGSAWLSEGVVLDWSKGAVEETAMPVAGEVVAVAGASVLLRRDGELWLGEQGPGEQRLGFDATAAALLRDGTILAATDGRLVAGRAGGEWREIALPAAAAAISPLNRDWAAARTAIGTFAVRGDGAFFELPRPAALPLELLLLDSAGAARPAGELLEMGPTAAGGFVDQRMRLLNTTDAAIRINTLTIGGANFSLQGQPTGAFTLPAGSNADFRVRFAPPSFGVFSAVLQVNDRTLLLRGISPQAVSVSAEIGGERRALSESVVTDLGATEPGRQLEVRVTIVNSTTAATTIRVLSATPSAFSIPANPVPLALAPGASATFVLAFASGRAGVFPGTLTIDSRRFPLTASAIDPVFPTMSAFVEPTSASGRQEKVRVELSKPAPRNSLITLTLTGPAPDDARIFPSFGLGRADIEILAGEQRKEISYQTGTVAGRIQLAVKLGDQVVNLEQEIAPAAPVLDRGRFLATVNTQLDLEFSGWDNTRAPSSVRFRFFDRSDRELQQVTADPSAAFQQYFAGSAAGGLFLLRAAFPVSGDPSTVAAAEVELRNAAGASRTLRITRE